MRSSFFVVLGLSGVFVLGACSSSTEDAPKAHTNTTAPGTNVNGNGNVISANGAATNGSTVAPEGIVVSGPHGVDANTMSTESTDPVRANMPSTVSNKMEAMASSKGSLDAAAIARKNARPAPDDSTFTSYLTDAGYEIRSFRSHPKLLKVERRLGSNGSQTTKVFLRDGKVIDVPPGKISSLATASADSIEAAAGVGSAPVAPPQGSTGAKKPGI